MESADYMGSTPFVRDVFKSLVALVESLEKSDYDAFLGDLQKRSRFLELKIMEATECVALEFAMSNRAVLFESQIVTTQVTNLLRQKYLHPIT